MAYEYKIRRRVDFVETDMAGIVHFSNYLRFMESVEHRFFSEAGLSIHMESEGRIVTFPRVHAECDYHAPLRFEEEFELRLIVREVRNKAMVLDFAFTRLGGGEPARVASGSITTVCVTRDPAGGLISIPIPQFVRDKIQPAPPEVLAAFKNPRKEKPHV